MSESSGNWDAYFAKVERYLNTHSLESEELNYKRETAQQLGTYRDELFA